MSVGDAAKLTIGIIAANDLNRYCILNLLRDAGYDALVFSSLEKLQHYFDEGLVTVDAWLIDLKDNDLAALDMVSDNCEQPLLVNDDIPASKNINAYQYWARCLLEKLESTAIAPVAKKRDKNPDDKTTVDAWSDRVWVLAASLGGPDAVKRFLQSLEANLPIAMVYAQHIDNNFDQQLVSALDSSHNYSMVMAHGEQILSAGRVVVVPVDRQLRFLPFGRVVATRNSWDGIYQPAIDQVISELARLYREKLGVIVFSGMCNDGEIGVRVAKSCGSTVWAQTPDSCASAEMPAAAIATGCVSEQGTPEQLAALLSEKLLSENSPSKKMLEQPQQTPTKKSQQTSQQFSALIKDKKTATETRSFELAKSIVLKEAF
jgi:chemosensory pili system protein ChpB (putative protein-glutamate methylesterase)